MTASSLEAAFRGLDWAPSTRARAVTALREWLGPYHPPGRSPADLIDRPRAVPPPVPRLSQADAAALVEGTGRRRDDDGPVARALALRDRALMEVLYGSGLRRQEACDLVLAGLDFEHDALRVVGKGGTARTVPITENAVDALRAWLVARAPAAGGRPRAPARGPRAGLRLAHGAAPGRIHGLPRRRPRAARRRARGRAPPAAPRRRHPPAGGARRGGRRAPAGGAGGARPRQPRHHPALHGGHHQGDAGRAAPRAPARMSGVDPDGFGRLAGAFLAHAREPQHARGVRARPGALAEALGVPAPPADVAVVRRRGRSRGRARRPSQLAALPLDWWQRWRDGLPGRGLDAPPPGGRDAGLLPLVVARARPREPGARPAPARRGAPRAGRRRSAREVVALSPAAVRRMCEAAAAPGPLGARTSALVEVLYGCGLRASEAAGLDLSACHLDDPDDPFLLVLGKGGRRRAVAVPREALASLTAYLRVGRPELRAARPAAPAGPGPPPRRRRGLPQRARAPPRAGPRSGRSSPTWPTGPACGRTGARVFPHALRHSCGTHLIQSGVDIRYVQAHLGHASPVTTEVYTHVTDRPTCARTSTARTPARGAERLSPARHLHRDAGAVAQAVADQHGLDAVDARAGCRPGSRTTTPAAGPVSLRMARTLPPDTGVIVTTAFPGRPMATFTRRGPAVVRVSPPGCGTGKSEPVTETVGAERKARYWSSHARAAAVVGRP